MDTALALPDTRPRIPAEARLSRRRYAVISMVYGLLFFACFESGSTFSWALEGSLWYPAAGLRWAVLLLSGLRFLPGIIAAEILAIALYGSLHPGTHYYDSWLVILVGLTPMLYGVLTALFIRWTSLDLRLKLSRDVAWLGAGTVMISLLASVLGRLLFCVTGVLPWQAFLPTAVSFWIGDMIGMFMITPLALVFFRRPLIAWFLGNTDPPLRPLFPSLPWRTLILDFSMVWATMLLLRGLSRWAASPADHLYTYLIFLPLLWIAFRRGLVGAVVGVFAVTSGASWFIRKPMTSLELFDLQVLIISLALTALLVGAAVSSQRRAQRQLRRHNRELREVKAQLEKRNCELESRRAEMSAFFRSVSHDLRNPLVTIGTFVGRLKKELETPEEGADAAKSLETIHRATDTLNRLLDGFVEFSRATQPLHQSPDQNLTEIAHRAVAALAPRFAEHRTQLEVAPDLPTVTGDRALLLQLFLHLIDNAAKFSSGNEQPRVEVGWRPQGEEQVIYVRDNGRGIDRRYHKKIFEIFDQLDHTSDGTGMGLPVVKRIVEEHGGRIWVESEGLGKGATIFFTLPSSPHGSVNR